MNKVLSRERIRELAGLAFEEDSQEERDFLEQNIDEITDTLIELEVTEETFTDFFIETIEKYDHYLNIGAEQD